MKDEVLYDQSTGIVWHRKGDEVRRLGVGYSGQPPYTNDPAAEAMAYRGPLPSGEYRIHHPFEHVRLGPVSMFLEPLALNKMHGRSGFFIHGDNSSGNRTASHGCIILKRGIREEIAKYAGCKLIVMSKRP